MNPNPETSIATIMSGKEPILEIYINRTLKQIHSMDKPNDTIILVSDKATMDYFVPIYGEGKIYISWFPKPTFICNFEIDASSIKEKKVLAFYFIEYIYVLINKLPELKVKLELVSRNTTGDKYSFMGRVSSFVTGNRKSMVDECKFDLINMRLMFSSSKPKTTNSLSNQLILQSNNLQFVIESLPEELDRNNLISMVGGYLITYTAKYTQMGRKFRICEAIKSVELFTTFLSFLSGNSVGFVSIKGMKENSEVWQNFSINNCSHYVCNSNWSRICFSESELMPLWQSYQRNCENEDLYILIKHWIYLYLEISKLTSGSDLFELQQSIVNIQQCLESLWYGFYTYRIDTNRRIAKGKNRSQNRDGLSQIKEILSEMNVSQSVSRGFTQLSKYSGSKLAPDVIREFRNMYVHPNKDLSKNYGSDLSIVLYQLNQQGLWYIELSILFFFGYNGRYCNRCSVKDKEKQVDISNIELVPWAQSPTSAPNP